MFPLGGAVTASCVSSGKEALPRADPCQKRGHGAVAHQNDRRDIRRIRCCDASYCRT